MKPAKREERHHEHQKRAGGGAVREVAELEHRGHKKIDVKRAHGGKVDGEKAKPKAHKRARGGSITDKPTYPHDKKEQAGRHGGDPVSAASVTELPFVHGQAEAKTRGKGKDKHPN